MGNPATIWRHRTGEIVLDRTRVMGILNVTPDSFSDGGRYFDAEAALRHGLDLVDMGADLVDVGGESTRPGSDPVSAEEAWRRVGPVTRALAAKVQAPLALVGVSRKSFLERLGGGATGDRLSGSIAAATFAVTKGAHVVRVHDVRETVRAVRVVDGMLRGEKL